MKKEDIETMLRDAAHWVGYAEKSVRDLSSYEDFTARAGKGNYTRFGRIADLVLGGADRRNKDGYPWCCMFILAVLYEMKAGRQDCSVPSGRMEVNADAVQWIRDTINKGKELTYFAGCRSWLNAYRYRGKAGNVPHRGDFVVYMKDAVFPGDRGIAYHIGIVESVSADGKEFVTIEGNTSAKGMDIEANGGVVARKKRKKTSACVFLENIL